MNCCSLQKKTSVLQLLKWLFWLDSLFFGSKSPVVKYKWLRLWTASRACQCIMLQRRQLGMLKGSITLERHWRYSLGSRKPFSTAVSSSEGVNMMQCSCGILSSPKFVIFMLFFSSLYDILKIRSSKRTKINSFHRLNGMFSNDYRANLNMYCSAFIISNWKCITFIITNCIFTVCDDNDKFEIKKKIVESNSSKCSSPPKANYLHHLF